MRQNSKPTAADLLERDFVKCRSRLLDIAAFLDRIDRYEGSELARRDFRYQALVNVLEIISSGRRTRTRDILLMLSDPTLQPAEDQIPPLKTSGAWKGSPHDH